MSDRRAFGRDGQVKAVYSDKWQPLLAALGSVSIERSTEIEYDNEAQTWVAKDLSGDVIATGDDRSALIDEEITTLEDRMAR